MTPSQRRQSGEGKIGFIFSVIVIILAGMVIAEWLPKRYNVGKLEDYMVEQAQVATRAKVSQVKGAILYKALELDLPVTKDNLEVTKGAGRIKIRSTYVLELDFPFFPYTWEVEHDISRPLFNT